MLMPFWNNHAEVKWFVSKWNAVCPNIMRYVMYMNMSNCHETCHRLHVHVILAWSVQKWIEGKMDHLVMTGACLMTWSNQKLHERYKYDMYHFILTWSDVERQTIELHKHCNIDMKHVKNGMNFIRENQRRMCHVIIVMAHVQNNMWHVIMKCQRNLHVIECMQYVKKLHMPCIHMKWFCIV